MATKYHDQKDSAEKVLLFTTVFCTKQYLLDGLSTTMINT